IQSDRRIETRIFKKLNSEQLQVATDENPTCNTRELSETFHVSRHVTIYSEMERLCTVSNAEKWAPLSSPHDLLEINKQQRVICCVSRCFVNFRYLFKLNYNWQ
ncbi:unnamed protein product, partial [Hymenolepis diminuta]